MEEAQKKESQVTHVLEGLTSNISDLHKSIDRLEGKLGDIVQPPQPEQGEDAKEENSSYVNLAFNISEKASDVLHARKRIDSILKRLEL